MRQRAVDQVGLRRQKELMPEVANFSTLCWHILLKSGALAITCCDFWLSFFLVNVECPFHPAFKTLLLWAVVNGLYGEPPASRPLPDFDHGQFKANLIESILPPIPQPVLF